MTASDASKAQKFFLQVIVCSAEGPQKIYPLVRALFSGLSEETRLLILCAEPGAGPVDDFGPFVEFRILPDCSAIDLRGHVPSQANNAEWVAVLEDHINVGADWLERIASVLRSVPNSTTCVVGAAANLTSKEPWSWANFLNVQAFHWAPQIVEPIQPLGFNIAYRRGLLPNRVLRPGEFEVAIVPGLMEKPQTSAEFPADHVQVRHLPDVLYYHFCNGRVSGAAIRDYHPDGLRHVLRHTLSNIGSRRKHVAHLIQEHPLNRELPAGTLWRVSVLALCHSVGALVGGLFGSGRAAWALE